MTLSTERKIALLLLPASFIFFLLMVLNADATYDAGDGIRHYLLSRYSWKHPEFLLHSWGKPFYTLIASPFAQFGMIGISVFNILCGIGAAWFTYRIAEHFRMKAAWLAIPFVLFTPCYFPALNSGLTEPLFSLVLIAGIHFVLKEKYKAAAIIVSLLPFVRSEGFLLMPLFGLVLLIRREFLSVVLLSAGTVMYSIIGYFYYKDFFWIITQNPYDGSNRAFYGTGELLHFVNNHNFIFGTVLGVLFIAGLLALLFRAFGRKEEHTVRKELSAEAVLVYGSFLLYFVAHSVMWWKGLANSVGLLRVIAGVAPCAALICLRGLQLALKPLPEKPVWIQYGIIAGILFMVIRSPFMHEYYPFRLDPEQQLVKESADWYHSSEFRDKKVFYLYPYYTNVLDIDPYDPEKSGELWGLYPMIRDYGIESVPDSSIIFWDAHFGPNECQIPLDTLMNDTNFQFVRSFKSENPTRVLGRDFEIYVFMRPAQSR